MQEDLHINCVVFISVKNDLPKLMKQLDLEYDCPALQSKVNVIKSKVREGRRSKGKCSRLKEIKETYSKCRAGTTTINDILGDNWRK